MICKHFILIGSKLCIEKIDAVTGKLVSKGREFKKKMAERTAAAQSLQVIENKSLYGN